MQLNKVILIGRITKDPELRRTSNNLPFCFFTLAVNRRYRSDNEQQNADFINCVAWDKKAEFLVNYIKKGSLLAIEGRIQTRKIEENIGYRMSTEVVCEDVTPLESKSDRQLKSQADIESLEKSYSPKPAAKPKTIEIDDDERFDEDAPF